MIGVLAPQAVGRYRRGRRARSVNRNNLVIAPLNTVMRRFEDNNSYLKDEIDGIYIKVDAGRGFDRDGQRGQRDSRPPRTRMRATSPSSCRPACWSRSSQTQLIFNIVMICIAGISLLVGGIGIMNIMLATVLERTREIGIRRAIGARQADIVRQFLTEAVLISIIGGLIGIVFGFTLSKIIAARRAGQPTWSPRRPSRSPSAFRSVIGLLFGIYPAVQAAKLDPIEAIRYE